MYQNAALDARIFVRTLHCNSTELITHPLQIHSLGTYSSNRLRLDACCRGLGYAFFCRG